MKKNKKQFNHWSADLWKDEKHKRESMRKIGKCLIAMGLSMTGSVLSFMVLAAVNATSLMNMMLIGFGASAGAVFVESTRTLVNESKYLKNIKIIEKCASKPKVEKLNKRELEVYNMMFDRDLCDNSSYGNKDKIMIDKVDGKER